MRDRGIPFEASDAVIWTTSSLLAVVIGVGASIGLWMLLRTFSDPLTLAALIMAIAAGLSLVVVVHARTHLMKSFLLVIAISMEITYLVGPLHFWR
jgi:hypothetical protein